MSSVQLTAKMENRLEAIVTSATKAESVTPQYVKTGKDIAAFLGLYVAEEGTKRKDGVKIVQDRLSQAGLNAGNVSRYLGVYAVVTIAPDAESLPLSVVDAMRPLCTFDANSGECRTKGSTDAKYIRSLVEQAAKHHWTGKVVSQRIRADRAGAMSVEEERQARAKERDRKLEKIRRVLEGLKPDTLAKIVSASPKLAAKLASVLSPKPQAEKPAA